MEQIYGVNVPLRPTPGRATPLRSRQEAYEAEPPVRILFDSGSGATPGAPGGGFEQHYATFPPPDVKAVSYYLEPDGSLRADQTSGGRGGSRFQLRQIPGDKVTLAWFGRERGVRRPPPYQWANDKPGDATAFLSAPLDKDQTFLGTGNADLWIKSSATDADLEVTLTEVRPDGKETYVQAGFLRASDRLWPTTPPNSTQITASTRRDASFLPAASTSRPEWRSSRSATCSGRVEDSDLRAHSRGDRPRWSWVLGDHPAGTTVSVAHDAPTRRGSSAADRQRARRHRDAAGVPSLRGQPCRTFVPYQNTPAT